MDHNHLLWDDTVAGPKPDRVSGKNKDMFQHLNNFTSSPSILSRSAPPPPPPPSPLTLTLDPVITRSITILKPNSSSATTSHDSSSSSVPSSPAGYSSSPSSPFSPRTPQFDSKGLLTARRKPMPAMTTTTTNKKKSSVVHEPRTPTVYDWVVISALDR